MLRPRTRAWIERECPLEKGLLSDTVADSMTKRVRIDEMSNFLG
jgi:hypothetical protein